MSKWKFRSLILLAMSLIGLICYAAMTWTPLSKPIQSLVPHAGTLSGILSGYAFTVAGFLATISTFLFTLHDKPFFRFFKKGPRRSFETLMVIHFISFLTLGSVFIFSLLMVAFTNLITLTLSLTITSLTQLLLITLISYRLTSRANDTIED